MKNSLLFITIFLLTQCADPIKPTSSLGSQFFEIDNARGTLLQVSENVTIFIPKNAFDHQNVLVEFKVATELEDMLLGDLYTISTL